MKIHLVMLGRTRRAELRALIDEYLKRLRRFTPVECSELKQAAALDRLKKEPAAAWVLLDAEGRQFQSVPFARWLGHLRDTGMREVTFLCGDAEGFPAAWRQRATERLSLGPLTLSHELARAVLAEQLYRAFALLAGHPYPK
ncbi:MAG TPA: 23S rRNA (pseudouridine(1915)-N(3))-methyltransferase RlmH [Candidatus Dormibacteraeota bacterium]|nr:23S rRNA (pseudouridine(1915)-N(3))-methyltransferase RlmH [Candidatus Dormibacteraeota bacterium]